MNHVYITFFEHTTAVFSRLKLPITSVGKLGRTSWPSNPRKKQAQLVPHFVTLDNVRVMLCRL